MVMSITSLTGSGLRDWAIQRLTAWVIAAYVAMLLGFMIFKSPMTFEVWQQFFQCTLIRITSIIFLFALVLHAWIGVWTITTDYLKCSCLRIIVQAGFAGILVFCLAWGIDIFWGL